MKLKINLIEALTEMRGEDPPIKALHTHLPAEIQLEEWDNPDDLVDFFSRENAGITLRLIRVRPREFSFKAWKTKQEDT